MLDAHAVAFLAISRARHTLSPDSDRDWYCVAARPSRLSSF